VEVVALPRDPKNPIAFEVEGSDASLLPGSEDERLAVGCEAHSAGCAGQSPSSVALPAAGDGVEIAIPLPGADGEAAGLAGRCGASYCSLNFMLPTQFAIGRDEADGAVKRIQE
jgi:hypothetical protein